MYGSWDSSIGIVNRLQASPPSKYNWIPDRGNGLFASANNPNQIWGKLSLLLNGYWGIFTRDQSSQDSVDHWPPSSIEVQNEYSYISAPSYAFVMCTRTTVCSLFYFCRFMTQQPISVSYFQSVHNSWLDFDVPLYTLWRNNSVKVDSMFILVWCCSLTTHGIWHGQALTGTVRSLYNHCPL